MNDGVTDGITDDVTQSWRYRVMYSVSRIDHHSNTAFLVSITATNIARDTPITTDLDALVVQNDIADFFCLDRGTVNVLAWSLYHQDGKCDTDVT